MALPNNPTPAELVKEVKDLEIEKQDKFTEISSDANLWELETGTYNAPSVVLIYFATGGGNWISVQGLFSVINNIEGLSGKAWLLSTTYHAESQPNGTAGEVNSLHFDLTPTENSTNPVTSGGVYNELLKMHPVGEIIVVDDANYDPASLYGGTWSLNWTKTFVENVGTAKVYGTGQYVKFLGGGSLLRATTQSASVGVTSRGQLYFYNEGPSATGTYSGIYFPDKSTNPNTAFATDLSEATNTTTLYCWERTA